MRSSGEQLAGRGYLPAGEEADYGRDSEESLLSLLHGGSPVERTAAIRLLAQKDPAQHLQVFCGMLATETKLYTKLELCEAIGSCGEAAIPRLAELLGTIGSNQHTKPVNADLGKKSFPLPRDIAARILIRLGTAVLPAMEQILSKDSVERQSEAIDVIGHTAWTTGDMRSERTLLDLYARTHSDLIRWKIVRALRSFGSEETLVLLKSASMCSDIVMKREAKRSLELRGK